MIWSSISLSEAKRSGRSSRAARRGAAGAAVAVGAGAVRLAAGTELFHQVGVGDERARHGDEIALAVREGAFDDGLIMEASIGNDR